MKKVILVYLFNIVLIFSGISQNVEFTKENFPNQSKLVKTALKNIRSGDKIYSKYRKKKGIDVIKYRRALDYYNEAQSFNPNNAVLNAKIADCNYNIYEPVFAAKHGLKAYELDSAAFYKILFFKAYALHQENQFDEAIQYYQAFENSSAATGKEKADAAQKIKECEAGKILSKAETNCFIDNMGTAVNSSFDDYHAVILNDNSGLYFTTRRKQEKQAYAVDGKLKETILISKKKENDSYSAAELCDNKFKEFESLHSISKNGKYAILYNSKKGGDLYEMKMDGKKWKVKPIKAINTSYHETSASLSANGDTLYFCSDRKKGFGGYDIYMSVRNDKGKLSKPKNIGDVINTSSDEISVFICPQGNNLYFSSKGHQTMGGFDILKTSLENGAWKQPENMGFPINSAFDDVYFSISDDGKSGYLSSNKAGGYNGQDIYKIVFLGEPKMFVYQTENRFLSDHAVLTRYDVQSAKVEEEKTTTVQGIVKDGKTKEPLFASIELSDIERSMLLATFTSDSNTGQYTLILPSGVNYGVSVKKEGYLYYSENFNVSESTESQTINQVIELNKIEVNQVIVLKNIFFDLNKTTLKPESTVEIENAYKLMVDNPTIEIEISGHTDNVGSAAYNKKLSQGRALAVVNALKAKGIDASRMKSVGYGSEKPIASNKTEAERAQNRRTEFKVIKK